MAAQLALLDASAIVALVSPGRKPEKGQDVILQLVKAGVAVTTPTGLAEALNVCRIKGYQAAPEDLVTDLLELGIRVEPLIAEDAEEIAFLLARAAELAQRGGEHANQIGGLSLGDAVCLAVAHRLDALAVVSDGTWELLDVRGLRVLPFR